MQVRKKSQKQESSVAKDIGGKTVVASGSRWFADSDVRSDKFLVECKTTAKDYFSVTTNLWEKITKEAIKDHGRIPLMVIDLKHDSVHDGERYVVFNPNDFDSTPEPYECKYEEVDPKSYRLTSGLLEEVSETMEMDVKGKLFRLKSSMVNKNFHLLMYVKMETFLDFYEKELEE